MNSRVWVNDLRTVRQTLHQSKNLKKEVSNESKRSITITSIIWTNVLGASHGIYNGCHSIS